MPKIEGVTRSAFYFGIVISSRSYGCKFPAHEYISSAPKMPTVIHYNRSGEVRIEGMDRKRAFIWLLKMRTGWKLNVNEAKSCDHTVTCFWEFILYKVSPSNSCMISQTYLRFWTSSIQDQVKQLIKYLLISPVLRIDSDPSQSTSDDLDSDRLQKRYVLRQSFLAEINQRHLRETLHRDWASIVDYSKIGLNHQQEWQ